jgi:hypothetical protein
MLNMSTKRMEVRLIGTEDAIQRDLPAVVTVLLGGQLFECQFRHYSIARSVVTRIVRENHLRLSHGVWKSKD